MKIKNPKYTYKFVFWPTLVDAMYLAFYEQEKYFSNAYNTSILDQ
jgi:hypothetical protein